MRIPVTEETFHNKKILILDDDRYMAGILRSILEIFNIGHISLTASTDEAIKSLQNRTFDCVFVDNLISADNGMKLVEYVRKSQDDQKRKIPIILCTAFTGLRSILTARDTGVTEVLAKPISPDQVMNKLSNALFNPRPFILCDVYTGPDRRRRINRDGDVKEKRRTEEVILEDTEKLPLPPQETTS
tara:strand:+ start:1853 stop:2413 length:561 start_codon:yes stop_codon:yes gene_type:complete